MGGHILGAERTRSEAKDVLVGVAQRCTFLSQLVALPSLVLLADTMFFDFFDATFAHHETSLMKMGSFNYNLKS